MIIHFNRHHLEPETLLYVSFTCSCMSQVLAPLIKYLIKSQFSWNLTKCPNASSAKHLPGFLECWRSPGAEQIVWVFNPESLGIWEQVGFTASVEQTATTKKSDNVSYLNVPFPFLPGSAPFPSDSAPSPPAVLSKCLFLSLPLVSGYFSAAARCLDSKSWVSVFG